jgi:tetratricopeptide (TPR) repeat protein
MREFGRASRDDIGRFNRLLNNAVEGYQRALSLNPKIFSAHLGLGDTYRVMGLFENSDKSYRNALALKPNHPKALAGLEKIRLIKAQDRGGFKTSGDIGGTEPAKWAALDLFIDVTPGGPTQQPGSVPPDQQQPGPGPQPPQQQ